MLISIVGNIACGKSHLMKYLDGQGLNIIFIQEPVDEWQQMLSLFYKDKKKYAFALQQLILITYHNKIARIHERNKDKIIITERSILDSSAVFCKMLYDEGNIKEEDYLLYKKLYDVYNIFPYDKIVYMNTLPDECLLRYKKRNREGEILDINYLTKIDTYYKDFLGNIDIDLYILAGNYTKIDIEKLILYLIKG